MQMDNELNEFFEFIENKKQKVNQFELVQLLLGKIKIKNYEKINDDQIYNDDQLDENKNPV